MSVTISEEARILLGWRFTKLYLSISNLASRSISVPAGTV